MLLCAGYNNPSGAFNQKTKEPASLKKDVSFRLANR
jgi:hypothetical protein